jgi:hypothetical protein
MEQQRNRRRKKDLAKRSREKKQYNTKEAISVNGFLFIFLIEY